MIKKLVLAIFLILICASPALAQDLSIPEPMGYVNDFEGILNNDEELEQKLVEYEKTTGNEIVVVTVKDFSGTTLEDYAVKLFEKWGIGKADKDNGLLFLVSKEQRQSRIEVGYGLEGVLTDAITGRIQDEKMIPFFKNENYSSGIKDGVDTSIKLIGGEVVEGVNDPVSISEIFGFGLIVFFTLLGLINNPWILGTILGLLGFALGNGISGPPLGFLFMFLGFGIGFGLGMLIKKAPPGFKQSLLGRAFFTSSGSFRGSSGGFGGFSGGSSGGGGSSRSW